MYASHLLAILGALLGLPSAKKYDTTCEGSSKLCAWSGPIRDIQKSGNSPALDLCFKKCPLPFEEFSVIVHVANRRTLGPRLRFLHNIRLGQLPEQPARHQFPGREDVDARENTGDIYHFDFWNPATGAKGNPGANQ